MALTFDGSNLGPRRWDDFVVSWFPATEGTAGTKPVTLYCRVREGTQIYPVVLKPNFEGKPDQRIVDEFKPFLGIRKMGSHALSLDKVVKVNPGAVGFRTGTTLTSSPQPRKADYLLFAARTDGTGGELLLESMLRDYPFSQWTPWYPQLQAILLFRELLRASDTNARNIIIAGDTQQPLSIDEVRIKRPEETWRHIGGDLAKVMAGVDRKALLASMIRTGGGPDPEQLSAKLAGVVQRIAPDYTWALVNFMLAVNRILLGP